MNTKARLDALERSGNAKCPRCVVRMSSGEVKVIEGLSAVMPFLDGQIVHIACDDPDVAGLLRAMDTDHNITIEIISNDGDKLKREIL